MRSTWLFGLSLLLAIPASAQEASPEAARSGSGIELTSLQAEQDAPQVESVAPSFQNAYREESGAWIGGLSVYILQPHWSGGNVSTYGSDLFGGGLTQQDFPAPFSASPAVWFGYTTPSGYGVQASFFNFDQSYFATASSNGTFVVNDAFVNAGFLGPTVATSSAMQITLWDLELTKQVSSWDWLWTTTAGVRYMHMTQRYDSNDGLATSTAQHNFSGAGPTLSLSGRRPFGSGGLGFYGSTRGALLFGNQNLLLFLDSGFGPTFFAQAKSPSVLPIVTGELGVDYRLRLASGKTLFVETGMVAQAYFDAGAPTAAMAGAAFFGPGITTQNNDATLGLFGMRTSIGVAF
jgi:hypothetical protein